MRVRTLFPATLGLLVLVGAACAQPPAEVETRLRGFVEAANRHDVDAMLAATDPAFRWMQVSGERIEIEVAGHESLRRWLDGYFRDSSDARSTLGPVSVDGVYASAVETVEFSDRTGARKRQSSTSVYEFTADGLIRNVWYFPAQPAASSP